MVGWSGKGWSGDSHFEAGINRRICFVIRFVFDGFLRTFHEGYTIF